MDRWLIGSRHQIQRWEVLHEHSAVGSLLQHPNVTAVTITYDDGDHTTTYWKEKPDE